MKYIIFFTLSFLMIPFNCSAYDYAKQFINPKSCDQILDKKYYKSCYNYKMKGILATAYTLDGQLVNQKNIKKRLRWYTDKEIPKQFRSEPSDYSHSGWDRGHSAPDADFDFSYKALKAVYAISNATPQAPYLNRHLWAKAEKYERYVAHKLGKVKVVNVIQYAWNPRRIGVNQIAVPSSYYKIIYNDKGFERCFMFKNSLLKTDKTKLKQHEVDCQTIPSPNKNLRKIR
ncbi:DNA/RNA non-specific endonuclease [Galenea microaerophila]